MEDFYETLTNIKELLDYPFWAKETKEYHVCLTKGQKQEILILVEILLKMYAEVEYDIKKSYKTIENLKLRNKNVISSEERKETNMYNYKEIIEKAEIIIDKEEELKDFRYRMGKNKNPILNEGEFNEWIEALEIEYQLNKDIKILKEDLRKVLPNIGERKLWIRDNIYIYHEDVIMRDSMM
jgi:hypothetical protein